ncbi:unnamed protein product [Mucor hiemalis]
MPNSNNKLLSCHKFLIKNHKNFNLAEFYVYYNFSTRDSAEQAFKKALQSIELKAKEDRNLNALLNFYRKEDFKALSEPPIEVFLGGKAARYKALQSAYVSNQLQSSVSIEVGKLVMDDLNVKRKSTVTLESCSKKTKTENNDDEQEKKKEEEKKDEDEEDEEEKEREVKGKKHTKTGNNTKDFFYLNCQLDIQEDRQYVLDFLEVNATNINELRVYKTKKKLSLKERLALSSISITNTAKLPKFKLSGSSYELVERWKKVLEENTKVFLQLPHPTNAEEMAIANTLSTLLLFNKGLYRKAGTAYKTHSHQAIKYLLTGMFHRFCLMEDIPRVQLHLRLQVSSSTKEHCTFGILFGGMTMEFSKLQFEAGKYDYSILKTINIPGPNQSDGSVEKTLEDMYSYKKMIEESLPAQEEEQSSFAFDQYSEVWKPTVRFLKST